VGLEPVTIAVRVEDDVAAIVEGLWISFNLLQAPMGKKIGHFCNM
jgi:hypothetical protein